MTLPLRHVSIRVPWHDTAWDGRVCANPSLNGSCLRLKGIAQKRDDAAEQAVAGQPLNVLTQEKWPCCVSERVSFMAPFELTRVANHPYTRTTEKTHGHFAPTSLRLPNPCRLLSREMLYTALTRQKNRVVILHQGARTDLRKFSSDGRSETARRLTNLFYAPSPIAIDGRFFEENLIHRTARGDMVRSKSEVIIADHLARRGVEYAYEQALTIDGETKYPDFTIEDAESGLSIFWEHCGMLHVPNYRRRWEEKLAWYKAHGIVPHAEGAGLRGTLVITRDNPDGSIDSSKITSVLEELLNA